MGYTTLNYEKRCIIEKMHNSGSDVAEIACTIQCHIASVYRELKRGNNNGTYSASFAQKNANRKKKSHGKARVLSEDKELAARISEMIKRDGLSPEEISNLLKKEGIAHAPTKQTIYSSIDAGIIPNISRSDLNKKQTHTFSKGIIQIPKWILKELNINDGDLLDIDINNEKIIISKSKK